MDAFVLSEITPQCASILALVTSIWTFTRMRARVSSETTSSCRSIIAFVACIRTFTRVRAFVYNEIATLRRSIIAFVTGEWTLARMHAFVCSESTVCGTSIIAFITCEWTLARMHARVFNEMAACRTPMLTFVAREWTLTHKRALICSHSAVCDRLRSPRSLWRRIAVWRMRFMPQTGQLATLGFLFHVTHTVVVVASLFLKRCLNGTQNQVLARPEIAREFSLERLPNSACRQLLACADGGADQSCHRSLQNATRNR